MAIPHAFPGMPVDLRPQDQPLSEIDSGALIKDDHFEAIRMMISKDQEACHGHHVKGPLTIQCLEGWIALTVDGEKRSLQTGQWTYLPAGVPHTLRGVEDSLLLLTMIF